MHGSTANLPHRVRVACMQWAFDRVDGWDAFAAKLAEAVRIAGDYRADFVLLPELFTCELLSAEPSPVPGSIAVETLTAHTPRFVTLLSALAERHRINVVAGTHLTRNADGDIRNVCYVALRDGTLHAREKIHATPNERDAWQVTGGRTADVIQTDCGPIGIAICYDSEFPELVRHLTDQGALILFVPSCTDDRPGCLRVRYSCHARAIENQVYVAVAHDVGTLRGVTNVDVQYGQSAVLTPCDLPFARDGVAVEATANVGTVVVAELDLHALLEARSRGTVRNLKDRREDLYEVRWKGR
jgi:predicted amidohydrolase